LVPGPGGQRAAIQAAKIRQARPRSIEKLEVIGGTAINTGTISEQDHPAKRSCIFPAISIKASTGVNYPRQGPESPWPISPFRALNVIKNRNRRDFAPSFSPQRHRSRYGKPPAFSILTTCK